MVEKLTIDDFKKRVNQVFKIKLDIGDDAGRPETLELKLVEVSPLGEKRAQEEARQPFSVIFRGPGDPVLAQQICALEHVEMALLDLFLVPVGPEKGSMLYEAVFN